MQANLQSSKKIHLQDPPFHIEHPQERNENHDLADRATIDAVARKQREIRERNAKMAEMSADGGREQRSRHKNQR